MDSNIKTKLLNTINNHKNTYIIFYTSDCGYSTKALDMLREQKVKYKGYDIYRIFGTLHNLIGMLKTIPVDFDNSHQTKPIIFFNGRFIGGFMDLQTHFKK